MTLSPGEVLPYLRARFQKLSRYVSVPIDEEVHLYADQDEANLVPAEIIEALEHALTPVVQAWERYVPAFYGGSALIVRAEVRNTMVGVIDDDPHLGWGTLIGGGLKLEHIACDHFDILRPEFADRLAAILGAYLLDGVGPPAIHAAADVASGARRRDLPLSVGD
jgi:thioesterase domain-containing protein